MHKVVATMAFLALVAAPAASFAKGSSGSKAAKVYAASGTVLITTTTSAKGSTAKAAKVVKGNGNIGPRLTINGKHSNPGTLTTYTGCTIAPNGKVVIPEFKPMLNEAQLSGMLNKAEIQKHIDAGIKASDAQPRKPKQGPGYPFAPGHDQNPFK